MQRKGKPVERAWRSRIARFRRSGLTVVEFCRREDVSTPSFYQWRKRLESAAGRRSPRRRLGGPTPSVPASKLFVPVSVSASPTAEVEFPNGVRVRVPATSAEAIRAAVLAGGDPFREEPSC